MTKPTCVRIEMEFSDGELLRAVGDDAEQIRKWIDGATVMGNIHGMGYKGPTMKQIAPPAGEV